MKTIEKIYQIFLKNKSIKIDSRDIKKGDIFFAISGKNFNASSFSKEALERGAELVIIDDELFYDDNEPRNILVNDSLETLQKLAGRYRNDLDFPFLAITGSNGKTTTKELTKEVLSKKYDVLATEGNFNNHLGVPLTILSIKPHHNFVIIEMGANHIGEIADLCEIAKPNFGVITNISKAHIGEFGNFDNIVKTKMALYDFLNKNGGKKFNNCQPVEILDDSFFLEINLFGERVKTNLIGDYNNKNIGIAVEIGIFFGVEDEKIIEAISGYRPTNNRSQYIKSGRNNIFLDAYNANPESMRLSLESFFHKDLKDKILIIGDMKELGEFSREEHQNILELIKTAKLEAVYVVGPEFFILRNKYNFNFLEKKENLISLLNDKKLSGKNILIKASRGIGLEEIVENNLV